MPGEPPPLPPRGFDSPQSLPYASPEPTSAAAAVGGTLAIAARVFHFGIFMWSLLLVVAWMAILVFILPRFEETYRDFKMELPATTKVLFALRTAVIYGGFAVLILLPFVLGFVSGPLGPGGRRAVRMIVTVVFAIVVVITVLGIFQPMTMLINGMTAGGK